MKKTLSFFLILIMAASMICAAQAESALPAYDGTCPLTDEKVTLTLLTHSGINASYPPPSNDLPFWQYMEELTNVHIEWEAVASESFGEVVSTRLAAGSDLPDIINVGDINVAATAGRNGLLVDMTPLLAENATYIPQLLESNKFAKQLMVQDDGSMYYIASLVSPTRNQVTYLYNKAWLEQIGEEIPTTTEDFIRVCEKMVGVDFNGNGKDDEIILTAPDFGLLDSMGTSFGLVDYEGTGHYAADENGKVFCDYTTDNMKNFWSFLNELYSKKILNQQIYTTTWNDLAENIAADRVGIFYCYTSIAIDYGNTTSAGRANPYSEVYSIGVPLKGPDGDQYMIRRDKGAGDPCAITRDCDNPELAMRWLDVLFAMPEVQETRYWGKEGMTYTVDADGNRQLLMPTDGKTWLDVRDGEFGGGQIPFAHQQIDDLWLMDYDAIPELKWWVAEDAALLPYFTKTFSVPAIPLTESEQEITDMYETDITDYANEMQAKFVTGEISFDEWDSFVATLDSMGVSEVCQAYQSVYDRTH